MKDLACFPFRWKIIALVLFVASLALSVANDNGYEISWLSYHTAQKGTLVFENQNLTDELWITGIIASLLILSFCREKVEDEYVRSMRLQCWQWAVVVNYSLLLVATWTMYGFRYLGVIMYNVLTPILLYLFLFYTRLHLLPRLFRKNESA